MPIPDCFLDHPEADSDKLRIIIGPSHDFKTNPIDPVLDDLERIPGLVVMPLERGVITLVRPEGQRWNKLLPKILAILGHPPPFISATA